MDDIEENLELRSIGTPSCFLTSTEQLVPRLGVAGLVPDHLELNLQAERGKHPEGRSALDLSA
jgi:hypothetical protein